MAAKVHRSLGLHALFRLMQQSRACNQDVNHRANRLRIAGYLWRFVLLALFVILGLGLTFALASMVGGEDDDDATMPGARDLTDDDDVLSDAAYRGGFLANFTDLVAEGEITQAEADAALAAIVFTDGPQDLAALDGDDLVLGGAGDDTIDAGAGDDAVAGGAGDDRVTLGEGADAYGSDARTVRTDDDIFTIEQDLSLFAPDAVTEGGDDTVLGGAGDDFIADGYGANLLRGQQGNDIIVAVDQDGFSPDTVDGGFGDDALYVDEGDIVTGSRGDDVFTIDLFGADLDGYQPVRITDFDADDDVLVLEGSPDLLRAPAPTGPGDTPADPVTVADSGTEDAVVSIAGVPVVIVQGGQGLVRADIRIST